MKVLKKARLLAGYTRSDVAERLGVSGQTVWNWEAGNTRPSLEQLRALERLYRKHDLIYELVDELEEEAKNEHI